MLDDKCDFMSAVLWTSMRCAMLNDKYNVMSVVLWTSMQILSDIVLVGVHVVVVIGLVFVHVWMIRNSCIA